MIEGARVWIRGSGLPIPAAHEELCTIGGAPARALFAASDRMAVEVPGGLDGGMTEIRVPWLPGATLYVEVGEPMATGFHQVDNPAIDAEGRIYVTYSGPRGQQSPVSVFRVTPGGAREPFVSGIVNATSMVFGSDGRLYLSSRFDGTVYRVFDDGRHEAVASELGLACGLAFAPDGSLFVGDRSGTIFQIDKGHARPLTTLPASVAAFHLAMGPDDHLYVTGPTLATYDRVYRVSMHGAIETIDHSFGRPQGLAFDSTGLLHVVEALAGASGVYSLPEGGPKTLTVAGPRLVGLAFGTDGRLVVATGDTIYGFG